MNSEGTEAPTVIKLLSLPGMLALALLGIAVLAASRLLGADTIIREMVTEVIAGFGNAILYSSCSALSSEVVSSSCFAGLRVGYPRRVRGTPAGHARKPRSARKRGTKLTVRGEAGSDRRKSSVPNR